MGQVKDCSNFNQSEQANSTLTDRYAISKECALFDFSLYSITVGAVCLLGLVGNTLSFVVLTRHTKRSATSLLLRALAVADTLVLIATVPLYVLPSVYPYSGYLEQYYQLYLTMLPFLWPVYLVPYTASILLTVLVSLDRYVAVCRPFKAAKFFSFARVRWHVVLIAVFAVLYNIPRFFEYHQIFECVTANESRSAFEISSFGENLVYRILYANITYFVLLHGGPLVTLAFMNAKLVQALRTRAERKRKLFKISNEGRDITLVLVVVIFVFLFCQTPTLVDHVLWTVVDEEKRSCGHWHYFYTAVGDALAILNSSVNFVIYFLTSRKFRQGLVTCYRRSDSAGNWSVSHASGRQRARDSVANGSIRRHFLVGALVAMPTSCTMTCDGRAAS